MNGGEARWNAVRSLLRARSGDALLERTVHVDDPRASFAQEGLWFLDKLEPRDTAYNLSVAFRLAGVLDVAALQHALYELVCRHEALRTTLHMRDGVLLQCIAAAGRVTLQPEDVRAPDVDGWAAAQVTQPFDLERGPLLRASLARVGTTEHCLLIVVHHAVFDAWSFEIVVRELCAVYNAQKDGRDARLPPLRLQYADFAAWQRQRLAGDERHRLLAYWKEQLRGDPPVVRLDADDPHPADPRRRAGNRVITLDRELADALKSLAAREGATLYMVVLAALQALLHRYTGEEDVIVGTPVAGRHHAGVDAVVGPFINVVPLRVRVDGALSFRELLGRVGEAATAAFAHQDLPLELLVKELQPRRREGGAPWFEVMLVLQNIPRSPLCWSGLKVEMRNIVAPKAKLDLVLTMQDSVDGLQTLVEYDADRFEAATMARLLDHFANLLAAAARDADGCIDELPLLSDEERRRVLARGNDTATPYPRNAAIHQVFEAQVRGAPDAIALVGQQETLSYDALNRRANRLARRLVQLQLPAEALIAVRLDRSEWLIVALLAIAKAGHAYVPLDPAMPRERAAALLGKVGAIVARAPDPASPSLPQVLIEDLRFDHERDDDLDLPIEAERLAYVMFTSGSTGDPRGVCIPHRGVVRLVCGAGYASFGPDEVFLQLAPTSFDAATFEIWGALLNGGKLAIAPSRTLAIGEICALIRRYEVTTLWLTAGLFEPFVDAGLVDLPSLRQVLSGGDVMSPRHAERFLRDLPRCRLINGYGPTENTTFTCAHTVDRVEAGRSIPVGAPITNTTIYLLDDHMQPVPDGVAGEAYAGGDGLARGYLDDDHATRERFVPSPFRAGERLYRTGDRVRRRSDGAIEFLGRVDAQVKVRGFRVEPAEVERVVERFPGVTAAAVIAQGRGAAEKSLVAYVVARRHDEALAAELRAFVRSCLPAHMVPSAFVTLERLPLTENGKLDRGALPPFERSDGRETVAARDALEWTLVTLFGRALDGRPVGIHDSFFDAGGDSLAAVRLSVEIERQTGIELPLAMLFARPTVAQLAAELRPRAPGRVGAASLITIKEGVASRPLFVMAGGRGGAEELGIYGKLFQRLDGDQRVLGLTAPARGLDVEQIASEHIATVRAVQPCGPYRLGGECVGGVVAFEMARQLTAVGESVALLLLIDSWCPTSRGVLHHKLLGQPIDLLKLGIGFLLDLPRRTAAEPWWMELRRRALAPAQAKRYIRACMRYRPRHYAGRIALLASDANLRRGIADGWRRVCAGVTVHRVPGNHQSYARQHAAATAEQLRMCIGGGE
ncbi:MAG: hypothetical protein JWM53_6989 [bacterium]|nr:hypothetical protein [bacterium]